jgi:L-aminopeptidase/D-esterase-like protein
MWESLAPVGPGPCNAITDVAGVLVGHYQRLGDGWATGTTVVLTPGGAVGGVDIGGGAPGTRETDLLRPGTLVQEVNAVLLTGGSAFGLAAADGVMRYLEERGLGFETPAGRVPIVPAAVLFDLGVGDPNARPGPSEGYQACLAASDQIPEGNAGAGTGATVAKLHGADRAVKGGQGTAMREDGQLIVGALAAVNALGEVLNEDGSVLAGTGEGLAPGPGSSTNTTLVVVATNARLSKERAHLVAQAAHEGIDAAIRPAHTMWDGDAAFALATGQVDADQRRLEELAAEAVAGAIRRAVQLAEPIAGIPSAASARD